MKRTRSRRNWYVILGVFVAVGLFSFLVGRFGNQSEVGAANMGAFDPGYIISDYQMGNYNSMSEAQIQAFLKSKNSCNDTDLGKYTYGPKVGYFSESTPYTWHVENGHYVCMADENFNGESAAHIIWQAAQDYRINPQVIIVVLQKEQGLVTDTFPNSIQYRSAMGYGCPDTAPCSPSYAGFKNQVRNAAEMFRNVLDGGWTNYPLGVNYVKYNPNDACGGSHVNIRNRATSALYRYTPYQPNSAVLNGGGDGCSAYGNSNFYKYFEDWFGGVTWDGWPDLSTVVSNNRVASAGSDLGVAYRAHIEHYGWLDWVENGAMAGTSGYSARLESLQLNLGYRTDGGIEYRAHVSDIGWQDWVEEGKKAGTTGESRRIEALQIRLTGEIEKIYDVYYRAHVQNIGWQDWVKNGELAGTTGKSLRIEAIQVRLVKKNNNNGLKYQVHVQDVGWMEWANNGGIAGTVGRSLRTEGVKIEMSDKLKESGDIYYRTHVQNIGWQDWVKNGELAGTTGKSLRVEAVEIKLSDELQKKYDVYYRTHVQNIGWQDWVKNGELAGTTGKSLRVEAAEIEIIEK